MGAGAEIRLGTRTMLNGAAEIRTETLPPAGADDVRVRTLWTAVSRGTERLVFEGRVRNHHAGRAVLGLAYEAYAELAEAEGRRIVTAIRERHGLHRALCVHRVGALEIGDVAVWVGVSAPHRDAAFVGCRAIIDAIKQDVPIWKHERYADGDAAWLHPGEGTGGR